jgi:SAM-dependent methyltransferase
MLDFAPTRRCSMPAYSPPTDRTPVAKGWPDHDRALAQYRGRAGVYDAELAVFEPLRHEAIGRLHLQPGERVLDVGCGTGLSFALLSAAVGPRGQIVGIEQSPDMLAQARERAAQQGMAHITLVEAPAASARITGQADAAVFHFTHDILRQPEAIAHVLQHLKPGARVVATGLKWAAPWAWPVNLAVLGAALYSVTAMEGLAEPWSGLAAQLGELDVNTTWLGGVYIATGVWQPARLAHLRRRRTVKAAR